MRYPEHDRASMRSSALEVTFSFQPRNGRRNGNHPQDNDRTIEPGNVPRLSKLMALAIRFDGLVRGGEVRDYADLARLGYVTARSRAATRSARKTSDPLPLFHIGTASARCGRS